MIKHVVLFKLKEFDSEAGKQAKMSEFKNGLEGLKNKINELRSLKVGININPIEDYDICLITVFDSIKDLETYANHPDHLAVGRIIADCKLSRACVDFEF